MVDAVVAPDIAEDVDGRREFREGRRWYKSLTLQVALAAVAGILLGWLSPHTGVAMQPLGDTFIRLIKMVVTPIAFLTIVSGVATVGDLKRVGRIGGGALLYFEVATTIALILGMICANVVRPGDGMIAHGVKSAIDVKQFESADTGSFVGHFLSTLVPDNIVGAFAKGDLLQVVLFGILFGCAAVLVGKRAQPILDALHAASDILFKIIGLVMRLAPLGAFGSLAFAVGKYGLASVLVLGKAVGCVYLTSAFFVLAVLGILCRLSGFRLLRFLRFIGDEIMIVVGTATSETVLPQLIAKLNRLGCSGPAASLVLPTGYSFNADGASIYLSIAALFIAQAYGIHLSLAQQAGVLLLLMLTSKGAGGVGGAGFITLAATLSATHVLPVEGLGLLVGVDRFMTQSRSVTNIIGNSVATVIVSRWSGEFDLAKANAVYAEAFGEGVQFSQPRRPAVPSAGSR